MVQKIILAKLAGLLLLAIVLATGWEVKLELDKKNVMIGKLQSDLDEINKNFERLKNTDQILANKALEKEIEQINKGFLAGTELMEKIVDLRDMGSKTTDYESKLAGVINNLAKRNYDEATAAAAKLETEVETRIRLLSAVPKAENLPVNNVPPQAGYVRQRVQTDSGEYVVDIITIDLQANKIVVDTASDSDCRQDCPVMSLNNFAQRSGAWAGINGPYFCPASYPACADKKNTFDTLLMNKNKTYFNSDNNVYSSVPAAIFSTSSRFVEKSADWGRDTGIDAVIAGQPLLVWDGQSRFGGDDDPKKSSIGNRSFIGATGNTAYLGIVRGVSVAGAANVIAKMGIKYAINLDSGGSTAMWTNGKYVYGPGRDTPFGIVVVRR